MLAVVSHNPKVWKPNFTDKGVSVLGMRDQEQVKHWKDNRTSMAKVDIIIEF